MDDLNKVTPHTYLPKYFIDKYGAELNGNKYNKILYRKKRRSRWKHITADFYKKDTLNIWNG